MTVSSNPAAMFIIEHRGQFHNVLLDKLLPLPVGMTTQFTTERLVQMAVTTLDIEQGYVKKSKRERAEAKQNLGMLVSSIAQMAQSPFSLIRVGDINPITGGAKLKFYPTNCKNVEEFRTYVEKEVA